MQEMGAFLQKTVTQEDYRFEDCICSEERRISERDERKNRNADHHTLWDKV